MSTQPVIEAEVVDDSVIAEAVEAEVVTVDTALVPYVSDMGTLETMVSRMNAHSSTAAALVVISPETKQVAAAHVRRWKRDIKDVEAFFKPLKQSIDNVKKKALDFERYVVALAAGPVAVVAGRIASYDAEIAREQEERRQRLIADEAARIRREQDAIAAALADEAAMLAAMGEDFVEPGAELAVEPIVAPPTLTDAQILEQAASDAPAVAEPDKVDGMYYASETTVTIHDPAALLAAVFAGTVPRAVVCIDESYVRQQAVAMGVDLGYPGVTVVVTKVPRFRSA